MKRTINAHITTLQVLFDLYIEAFFEKTALKVKLLKLPVLATTYQKQKRHIEQCFIL